MRPLPWTVPTRKYVRPTHACVTPAGRRGSPDLQPTLPRTSTRTAPERGRISIRRLTRRRTGPATGGHRILFRARGMQSFAFTGDADVARYHATLRIPCVLPNRSRLPGGFLSPCVRIGRIQVETNHWRKIGRRRARVQELHARSCPQGEPRQLHRAQKLSGPGCGSESGGPVTRTAASLANYPGLASGNPLSTGRVFHARTMPTFDLFDFQIFVTVRGDRATKTVKFSDRLVTAYGRHDRPPVMRLAACRRAV